MKYDGKEAMTIHYQTYTQALYMYKYSVMQNHTHTNAHTRGIEKKTMKYNEIQNAMYKRHCHIHCVKKKTKKKNPLILLVE